MTKERAKAKAIKYLEWAQIAIKKSEEIYKNWNEQYQHFDWTQPILKGHHSQKRHEKIYEKRTNIHKKINALDTKAKSFIEKANNLNIFANTHKGDAEKRRQAKRENLDNIVKIGTRIVTLYGHGAVVKINKKTYMVQYDRGFKNTVEKHLTNLI